ncbi:MAG: hypothetical protein HETSPECPRED_008973 [Heterodermia speciosa]|uniref:STAS domain-containing protein n=1 Tax=Heterodermia speciosa TaxID=116794 RepID=A0A8H3G348_9LECA|nr:MAG: hypothetical protein HETSPECPRED_008973 [Heterodermia speciosa]
MSSHPPLRSHSRQTSLVNHPSRLRQSHAADSDPAPDSFVDEPTTLRHSEESTGSTLVNAATSARDRLVDGYFRISARSSCNSCGTGDCEHGILSPHIFDHSNPKRRSDSYGGKLDSHGDVIHSVLGDAVADGLIGGNVEREDHGENGETNKMSTTDWLARRHGITGRRSMYITYYFPFLQWIFQYKWAYLQGDLIAALTMASFYLPMSLSYASNLAHVPPINGLYSFVFNPVIYAFLGSCPQMVVGPEAAGSLLVGQVIRTTIDKGATGDEDTMMHARVAGVVTGMAGAIIFIAGITRLGFLDSVLSRPFLRGFISAIGFVILVDQLIPELGLAHQAKHAGSVSHGSSLIKLIFLVENIKYTHGLTAGVAFGSFAIIMFCRFLKRRLQPRYPSVAYVPDRFIVVVLSAVFTWRFGWHHKGLEILGNIHSTSGSSFTFHWPFIPSYMNHIQEALSTSFLIALLGFFESSVAAKSLGGGEGKHGQGIQGMTLSANRELVALGVANLVGGCSMALPAFGGYGRSKVNASTGGTTPMSSIFLSLITVICVLFLLPYFHYLPKAVLSSMISVVAYSLVEECPHDIKFFVHIRGWSELTLMFIIFAATIFYSLTLGIALGVGLSLLSVIRHATKPRIQILGKVPGTDSQFENAEANPQALEFIEGCLIVKMPEPLTFANTGDLKNRLRRLELYGTTAAHPALPRVRAVEHNQNIIFDVHGVTGLDGSGTQVLAEIVDGYVSKGTRVFFCRVPKENSPVFKMFEKSGIVERCGGLRHFVKSVDEALRMTEVESLSEFYRDNPEEPRL